MALHRALPPPALGLIAGLLLLLNILFWVPLLLALALVKLALPLRRVRLRLDPLIQGIAQGWIGGNSAWMRLTQALAWDVQGLQTLQAQAWYLVLANHQSWVDIFVLQHLLNRRIPMLKFFLKRELIWVPIMGLAWWALEFPFMRRRSAAYLARHPAERGRDAAATRAACAKYALVPTCVMNFVEGTRCTPAKQRRQGSPYRHLLKPRAGGLALALDAMGERFTAVLDVTIAYPEGVPTFWQFMCGRMHRVVVRLRTLPVPPGPSAALHEPGPVDTPSSPEQVAAREAAWHSLCASWVNHVWADKDALLEGLLNAPPLGPLGPQAQPRSAAAARA